MMDEGRSSRAPLKEAFLEWRNLKLVLLVLFGLMSVQGVLWYTAHFYSQFFLTQILHVDAAVVTLIMTAVTGISVLLYVLFSWLSDHIGRKRIMLTGMVLAILAAFPLFKQLTAAANPALAFAQANSPVTVFADPDQCSFLFDPMGRAVFVTSCDVAKNTLTSLGIPYDNETAPERTVTQVHLGDRIIKSFDGSNLSEQAASAAQIEFRSRLVDALREAGYSVNGSGGQVDRLLIGGLIFLFVVFAVMVYAPMPAMVIELFPTRIRYSALSLPYHIGSGWFGGFLPAIAFALVAATGDIYSGLWYPMIVTAAGVLALLCLPETRNRNIEA
jgi:hypothetical protein